MNNYLRLKGQWSNLIGYKSICLEVMLVVLMPALTAQTTYTWNQAGSGAWTTSTNWTPTRSSPATNDILVISNGGTKTISSVPTQTIGRLTISGSTNVTLSGPGMTQTLTIGNGTGDDLVVANGSSLTISSTLENIALAASSTADISGTYTNDSDFELGAANVVATVTGTFINQDAINGATTSKLVFASGSTYEHDQDGGTTPTATWDVASNCTITGITGNYPSGMSQTFGNVTFENNLSGNVTMNSSLTCAGNLTISNVNDGEDLRLTNSSTDRTISVGGNFILTSGNFVVVSDDGDGTLDVSGNFSISGGLFVLKEDNGAAALNVTGDFTKTGGIFTQRSSGSSTATVTIGGDFNHSSGNYNISSQNDAAGTLNIAGDFSHTGGTLQETGSGSSAGNIFFNGSGTPQVYTGPGAFSGTINFTVNNGAILDLGGSDLGSPGGSFTLNSTGTLQMDIDGTSSAQYGQISVGGNATVNGIIEPTFSFTPALIDAFLIITFSGTHSGTPTLDIKPPSVSHTYSLGVLSSVVLPIQLLHFQGKKREKTIELTWSTQSEVNNDYMAVERSGDGKTFAEIGRITGARTTYEKQTYTLVDEKPLHGMNYYRLRQVDFDGAATLHKVIGIRFGEKGTGLGLLLSPNPATDRLVAEWSLSGDQPTDLRIFDLNGRQLAAYTAPAGSLTRELPLYDLPAGTYILRANQGQEVEMMKFVKR